MQKLHLENAMMIRKSTITLISTISMIVGLYLGHNISDAIFFKELIQSKFMKDNPIAHCKKDECPEVKSISIYCEPIFSSLCNDATRYIIRYSSGMDNIILTTNEIGMPDIEGKISVLQNDDDGYSVVFAWTSNQTTSEAISFDSLHGSFFTSPKEKIIRSLSNSFVYKLNSKG